jgi:hypothetical protein
MSATWRSYEELSGFEHLYLEDSFVLGMVEGDRDLRLSMKLVLTPAHPGYQAPPKGTQHCYRVGTILFSGIRSKQWLHRTFRPSTDASSQVDYGSIDTFLSDAGVYVLEGDWGEVRIEADTVSVHLHPAAG